MVNTMLLYILLLIVAILLLISSFRMLWEYERGVVFLLGRFYKIKGPGLVVVVPFIQQIQAVSLRVIVLDIPTQDVISSDNVSLKVSAVLYFQVIDPQKAIIQVESFEQATSQLAQTTLRSLLGKNELDVILAERAKLNTELQHMLDEQTETWGIKVIAVEIKKLDLDESMIRAIAKQAEAERDRRAKVIHAEGEKQASETLLQASQVLAQQPEAMVLRYLQTLGMIAEEQNSTIVFPLPLELLSVLKKLDK